MAEVAEALEARREVGKKKSDPRGDVDISFIEEREARRELDPPPSTWKRDHSCFNTYFSKGK